jgi:aminoglycoside phosphotransferase family enzyme/predicted kinase
LDLAERIVVIGSSDASEETGDRLATLVAALGDAGCYDHPVDDIRVLETHISYVVLTGPFAYKIKKPVTLPFLDFGTLEDRKHYCDEELRINLRLAPELYVDVVTITGSATEPRVNGTGTPVEYAVRMRQFPDQDRLDHVAARGELRADRIRELGGIISRFHQSVETAGEDSRFGDSAHLRRQIMDNFHSLRDCPLSEDQQSTIETIRAWSAHSLVELGGEFRARRRQGFVRECHGDMHLANMALMNDQIVIFDALEFNANLRWIDVASEMAFVLMDLDYRAMTGLAWLLLCTYLDDSGDYAGLRLLRHYQVYRAMVRAKVAGIRSSQCELGTPAHDEARASLAAHVALAERYTRQPTTTPLVITHGLSGSGKSWLSERLLQLGGAIRIRSDVERKRPTRHAPGGPVNTRDTYSPQRRDRNYSRIAKHARMAIDAGFPVIVDATFLKRGQRESYRLLAGELGVPFTIVATTAPRRVLEARLGERQGEAGNVSDADYQVLRDQIETADDLDADEREHCVSVDTSTEIDMDNLVGRIFTTG